MNNAVFKKSVSTAMSVVVAGPFLVASFLLAVYSRVFPRRAGKEVRIVWGTEPIINNVYWSRAMSRAGWSSETFTTMHYSINERSDWNRLLEEEFSSFHRVIRPYLGFLYSLLRYDIFFLSFRGLFIGETQLWRVQHALLKFAGKKIVMIPYGSDSYVYRRVKSSGTSHGLMTSYPQYSREQGKIAARVDYWATKADVVIPGFMGRDGIGRWDVNIPSPLFIDLDQWRVSERRNTSAGLDVTVTIAHSPNHRGFKGTEFLLEAVKRLKAEGLKIELLLLEKIKNDEVKSALAGKADIFVEQLVFDGYAMSGLEGMATGLPVIANLDNDDFLLPFRRWSFLSECPILSASPESVYTVLKSLVLNPQLRHDLGDAGRKYVEKYHGLDSAEFLFHKVLDFMEGKPVDLIGLYHPLLGEYSNRLPRIETPLTNNRISTENSS